MSQASWFTRALCLLSTLTVLACGGAKKAATDGGAPGYDSPALDGLVRTAVANGPPRATEAPYARPARVDVPPLPPLDLSWLPQDAKGRAVLEEVNGTSMTVNTKRRDAVTATGACVALVTRCQQPPRTPNARSLDACWISAPACATNQPWTEAAACCPVRCRELYETLRGMGYPHREAHRLTISSLCFNGLTQLLGGS